MIAQSYEFTEDEWCTVVHKLDCKTCQWLFKARDNIDVIDMTNSNLSVKEKECLIQTVSSLLCNGDSLILSKEFMSHEEPVLLHHTNQSPDRQHTVHYVHFGQRTAVGPAGTRGAPSQTLRRTHRGILKQYALKQRTSVNTNAAEFARSNISTAMEPEIGFLMANLAMSGRPHVSIMKVLDPCCGSGSLLLYAAALGATNLVGVDSNPSVWDRADIEFHRHGHVVPKFVEGDVFNPRATKELSTPNLFDSLIADPPYNIGAPVIVDKQESRQKNRFKIESETSISERIAGDRAQDITLAILLLAANVLVNGGRIVFFLPTKGTMQPTSAIENYQAIMQSKGLKLVLERKQQFTPTFCRWLVCLEKILR